MLLHSQYLPLMISPGRDWNSKYMINQLIRTKDFSLLHHLLRNPPPSHLLHKSLDPSPLTQATLSLTFSTLHPFPHLLRNPLRPSYTIHPSPQLLHNPPLPSSVTQYTPSLPARLAQSTPPCLTPLSHWQSPHRQVPSPLHTSASDELSLGKHKFHSWCNFTVERLRNSLWS